MPFAIRKPHHSAYQCTPSGNPSVRFVNSASFSCTLGGGGWVKGAQFVNLTARCTQSTASGGENRWFSFDSQILHPFLIALHIG